MNKTLAISFALKNTYRVNSIIYSIRQIPLIGKFFSARLFDSRGLKVIAYILAAVWELIMAVGGKLLYFVFLFLVVADADTVLNKQQYFLHIMVFLTIIGSFSNTFLFNPTKDKYYAIVLMRMDAKSYVLWNYGYALVKILIGFGVFGTFFGMQMGLPLKMCLLLPFFAIGIKAFAAAWGLWRYEKTGVVTNENKLGVWFWGVMILLLAVAYGLPLLGWMLPEKISVGFMLIWIPIGFFSLCKIATFQKYNETYKELLRPEIILATTTQAVLEEQRKKSHNDISEDTEVFSNREGVEYLNDLFVKRHRKIFMKPAKILSIAGVALVLVALVAIYVKPEFANGLNKSLMNLLPYFLFIMYTMNRGAYYTRLLFVNCDHSLFSYSFFRQPGFLLKLFQVRLCDLVKMNLQPALVVGGGLAILLFCSGGAENPMDYVILIVSILCMSIFFSVHYLTLYYLLQPFNSGTEVKSASYQIVTAITGLACYVIMTLRISIAVFGLIMIIFTVVYCAVAFLLVYRLAAKTFRLRA